MLSIRPTDHLPILLWFSRATLSPNRICPRKKCGHDFNIGTRKSMNSVKLTESNWAHLSASTTCTLACPLARIAPSGTAIWRPVCYVKRTKNASNNATLASNPSLNKNSWARAGMWLPGCAPANL